MNRQTVTLVTVTYNSSDYLKRLLDAALSQTYRIDNIVIVDNHSSEEHIVRIKEMTDDKDNVTVIYKDENTGGAGGFETGMQYTFDNIKPDWYWIMDDDACPRENTLEELLKAAENLPDAGFVAPLIWGLEVGEYQHFHHKRFNERLADVGMSLEEVKAMSEPTEIDANAFVGPLFAGKAVESVGVADGNLFIYGDDTEYTYRVTRRYKGYVCPNAVINHRDQVVDWKKANPLGWWKDYYSYRNKLLFIEKYALDEAQKKKAIKDIKFIVFKLKVKARLYKDYKGLRDIRIEGLNKAIKDGLAGNTGKLIDPAEYNRVIRERENR